MNLNATHEELSATGGYRASHTRAGKACEYDRHNLHRYRAYLWEREQSILLDVIRRRFPGENTRCLDFACGTGRILQFLELHSQSTVGIDISEEMIAAARNKLHRTELFIGDLTRENPLRDRRFDLITAFRFFLNAEPELRRDVIHELGELLSPTGLLVFNNHMNRFSAAGFMVRANNRLRGGNNKTWRIRDMRCMVAEAGLKVAEIHHVGVIPGWERYMILPSACYRAMETVTSRLGGLRHIAQDIIFVCTRATNMKGRQA